MADVRLHSPGAAQVLVPLKDLVGAKTRLAGMLGPIQRRALARAMAEDVLKVLATHPLVAGVTLVSDDPQAASLADTCNVDHWTEKSLGCSGLNAVIAKAAKKLRASSEGQVIVLHADIPLLGAADITAVLSAQRASGGLVIGCDQHGSGTNLLAFDAGSTPQFHFGADSCAAHERWANDAGVPIEILHRPGIAQDVDEPEDLITLSKAVSHSTSPRTASLLRGIDLHGRSTPAPSGESSFAADSLPTDEEALALADVDDTAALARRAAALRDTGHGNIVTYSRKVFIPLTQLCRDVCHYCTFAQTPKKLEQIFMPVEEVLELCRQGATMGCQEALFTLGEKPELRYNAARAALAEMGYSTTLEYVADVASRVLEETGLLPHINAGCMTAQEIAQLRTVSASMGIMLESASERLCEKGMPHYGSPDKEPAKRLETMALAGEAAVPFTSGILIGIGETRRERIESLLALRATHTRYGHLQEVIVQNFRAKPGTLMSQAPEPDLNELLWTIAVARIIFGATMNIQAPPNLSPGVLPQLVDAGINDWGGVSPLTPDHVNPEAPWPHLDRLANETAAAGKFLEQRLTIYPAYASQPQRWLDKAVVPAVLAHSDASGYARRDNWVPGEEQPVPEVEQRLMAAGEGEGDSGLHEIEREIDPDLQSIIERCKQTAALSQSDVVRLLGVRGQEFTYVVQQANALREAVNGNTVSYVVNRNINYTNVCYFKCQFCAFSKGKQSENLRGRPYDISAEDLAARTQEAWQRGATEVCMQGGIHPDYTGQTYLDILQTVRQTTPAMHIHAFSPLEVWQGAATLGLSVKAFIQKLISAGLNTLPGTAAEVLDDEVRAILCPDKINTQQWLQVMETAHGEGLRTTATIMYGHVERPRHWATHLLRIRQLQQRTGGFTEFVPLPFVHMEAPMYLKGHARKGPTFREAILIHAVSRLVFHGLIDNIQASWVKMGEAGVQACLKAGVNDLGGSLMNESITRAAGTEHGQEWAPAVMEQQIRKAGRKPRMRNTLYGDVSGGRRDSAFAALPLAPVHSANAAKKQRSKRLPEVQTLVLQQPAPAADTVLYEQVVLHAACN